MDRLEQSLRDLLCDERLDLPVAAGAVRAVHDGVRRRRRNRGLAIVASAAATTVVVLAALLVVGGPGHRSAPPVLHLPGYDVSWVDAVPPPLWTPPVPHSTLPTMTAPPCRADELRVGPIETNGAGGVLFVTLPLRNVGTTPCRLVGRPERVAAREPGQPDVVATSGLGMPTSGVGGDLAPGHRGYLTLQTDRDCPARYATPGAFPSRIYHQLAVTLPSGTDLSVPARLDVECGLHTGGLGVTVRQPTAPPDPRGVLRASLDVPRVLHVGDRLSYVVTLTNPTARTVPLHCPAYTENGTSSDGGPFKETYGLNCADVTSIPAFSSVSYEMRMKGTVAMSRGTIRLFWSLDMPASVTAQASVAVR